MLLFIYILDASGVVKFWLPRTGDCLGSINECRQLLSTSFNATGSQFTTTGSSPQIYLYDVETMQIIATFEARYYNDHQVHIIFRFLIFLTTPAYHQGRL